MQSHFRPLALLSQTPPEWTRGVMADFDAFILDHAACERKACANGMSFVVRYPDRPLLIEPLIAFAREELEHFHQVFRLVQSRGLTLTGDTPDAYVNKVMKAVRNGRDERLLDRLIASSVIESRGHERFSLVTEALTDPAVKLLYQRLTRAEDRHKDMFVDLAALYFSTEQIEDRADFFLKLENEAINSVPFRAALY